MLEAEAEHGETEFLSQMTEDGQAQHDLLAVQESNKPWSNMKLDQRGRTARLAHHASEPCNRDPVTSSLSRMERMRSEGQLRHRVCHHTTCV